ncbi:hypothetical protein V1264_000531 [Littorina saxatilis]|uniref:Uncharacterized protein n=1 Tax=Littorina saxatilis TaxID=31220 RepID=A0AAN9BXE3_9CAEN
MIFSLILLVISCSLRPTAAAATPNSNTASDDSLDITVFKSLAQRLERLEETVNVERQERQQQGERREEERKEWLTIKQEASAMLQTLKDMKPNTETSPRTSAVRYDSHDRSRRDSAAAALAALGDADFDQLLKTLQRVLKDVPKIEKKVDRVRDQAEKSRE